MRDRVSDLREVGPDRHEGDSDQAGRDTESVRDLERADDGPSARSSAAMATPTMSTSTQTIVIDDANGSQEPTGSGPSRCGCLVWR